MKFCEKKIRRNSGTIVLLSENVTALKLSERLKIDEMYSRIGLSFGQPDNTYYCFKCTYNGEICHSQSKNVSAPYKAVRNSTDKNTLLMQSNFPKVRTKVSRPEKKGRIHPAVDRGLYQQMPLLMSQKKWIKISFLGGILKIF